MRDKTHGSLFRREIRTDYQYNLDKSLLWKIITDFSQYPSWNNFILKVSGEAVTATRIKFLFQLPRWVILPATATILVVQPERELRWKGSLPVPGLLSAEHYYIFNKMENDQCDLCHGEIFRGLLVPFLWPLLRKKGTPVYEENNLDLNNRALQLYEQSTGNES